MVWMLYFWLSMAWATTPGSEIVVILDTSCSMAAAITFNQSQLPANDPDRLAVLGAQIVADLGSEGVDDVTVLGFGQTATSPPEQANRGATLREWSYTNGTYFRSPLTEASQIFARSEHEDKLLLFLTDGVPSPEDNINNTDDLLAIFNPRNHPDVAILPIGLFNHPDVREMGTLLLSTISHSPDDVHAIQNTGEIVEAFTIGFARAIGSRPETGQLSAGQRHSIVAGRYVSEVLVITASSQPGPAFSARLETPSGAINPIGQGDNGCANAVARQLPAAVCAAPRRHYQVFRAPHDPQNRTTWSLELPDTSPDIQYGVILRYDLTAGLEVAGTVSAGTEVPIEARLIFQGQTFDDPEFFAADGFVAVATVEGEEIILAHAGGGLFTGTWTPPDTHSQSRQARVDVRFTNTWMQKSATQPVTISPPPYTVVLNGPLDLNPVPSQWAPKQLCGNLSLEGSRNIDDVDIRCTIDSPPSRVRFSCERSGPQTLTVCAETQRWCCGPSGTITVTAAGPQGQPPRTAASTPVTFSVDNPGLLRCYWLPISITLLTIFLGWFVYGWLRPHRFEPSATITLAGSERGLRRSTPQILEECPGGKRGFYRNARACFSATGDAVRNPRQAVLVVEAAKNNTTTFDKAAGLERRDRRTRKWEVVTPEEMLEGYIPGTLYRMGDLIIRFD